MVRALTPPKHITMTDLRKAKSPIVALTAIHNADAIWIDQLLAEYTRLNWNVAWHFNNLSKEHCERLADYPGTVGYSQAAPGSKYWDYDHIYPMIIAQRQGAKWMCVHNTDETMEPNAPAMIEEMLRKRHLFIARWYNIWERNLDGSLMIRVDGPFIGHKSKFYPVGPWSCTFKGGVASMYIDAHEGGWPQAEWTGLRILHWGFCTEELRKRHHFQWKGTKTTQPVNSDYWESLYQNQQLTLKRFDPSVPHDQFVAEAKDLLNAATTAAA